jgi:hypothetical protein
MTPKETAFVYSLLEEVAKWAYNNGYDDCKEKRVKREKFVMSSADKLRLQAELLKATTKRA